MDLVAFDPGGTTGVVEVVGGKLLDAYQLTPLQLFLGLRNGRWSCYRTWVVEEFLLYPWKAQEQAFTSILTLRLIGAIQFAAYSLGSVKVAMQTAQEGKGFATDQRLKEVGWWPMLGSPHQRDAARHALLYLTKEGKRRAKRPTR